jgi:hypothetical protein
MKHATARTPRRTGPRCHQGRGAVVQHEVVFIGGATVVEDGAGASGHRPSAHVCGASAVAASDFSSGSTSFAAGVVAKTGSAVTAAE